MRALHPLSLSLLIACGAPPPSTELSDGSSSTSSGWAASTGTSADAGEDGSTGAEDGSTGAGTGVVFVVKPDGGPPDSTCDPYTQDCPPGEKCMPWANDGGGSWNATRCVAVAENPGAVGDPCTVEGSGTSGIDDCEVGVMCWDVDPETNTGTCVAMCTGDEANPICEDPSTACAIANDGVLNLCLPVCDPLLQDCTEGQACYPINDAWSCAPDASGEGGVYGDPCEFINVCDPGLICLGAAVVPPGEACEGAAGCCTEVCDLSNPAGDLQCSGQSGGQTCQPWYEEGSAPPGYEDVGACALPG